MIRFELRGSVLVLRSACRPPHGENEHSPISLTVGSNDHIRRLDNALTPHTRQLRAASAIPRSLHPPTRAFNVKTALNACAKLNARDHLPRGKFSVRGWRNW